MINYKGAIAAVLLTVILSLVVFADGPMGTPPTTQQVSYSLPKSWAGSEEGAADGNPMLQDGVAIWRLDHIWPDDWREPSNYNPLVWTKGRWGLPHASAGEQLSRPQVRITHSEAIISAFASRFGGQDPFSNKTAALVFIAPRNSTYEINCTAEAKTDSKTPVSLLVLKKDKISNEIKKLSDEDIQSGQSLKYAGVKVELKVADELIFVPYLQKAREGGTIDLQDFSISESGGL